MRLIDADELIKQFHYGGIADSEEDKAWTATVRRTIKAQPTAYDIDEVVERLGNASCYIEDGNGHAGHLVFTDEAIEIVKGGGTDE